MIDCDGVPCGAPFAQIKPSRTWLDQTTGWLEIWPDILHRRAAASMMGGAEMYRAWGSYQHEQAWQLRVHTVSNPIGSWMTLTQRDRMDHRA
ncbi:MAG: hypothetical protein IPP80_09475 [Ignavibacteria bacterium]|nr:hypothetical protein [Ignavibacteria bacterium]